MSTVHERVGALQIFIQIEAPKGQVENHLDLYLLEDGTTRRVIVIILVLLLYFYLYY